MDQQRRYPARGGRGEQTIPIEDARYRRFLCVHIHHTGTLRIFLLASSAHDRLDRGRSAIMLDRTPTTAASASWAAERAREKAETKVMSPEGDAERTRRFREAALPHLDDVFTLAHYLMRNTADAEDAAQECFLRALRHFDSYRGPAMKPWLLTILRNVCNSEFARRGNRETPADLTEQEEQATSPIWREPESSPETVLLRQQDG